MAVRSPKYIQAMYEMIKFLRLEIFGGFYNAFVLLLLMSDQCVCVQS